MDRDKIIKRFLRVADFIQVTFKNASMNFDLENTLPDRNIDAILENPADKKKLDEAVEYLKMHREEKNKEVTLSDNQKLLISIS